jgi:hypothetical protein
VDVNPYQSPLTDYATALPDVEVVHRHTFVWRNFEQIYRFECPLNLSVVRDRAVGYFQRQDARLLHSTDTEVEFKRTSSFLVRLFSVRETRQAQTIIVSLEKTTKGSVVTCRYRVRLLTPDLLHPPHRLEEEVRRFAAECIEPTQTTPNQGLDADG